VTARRVLFVAHNFPRHEGDAAGAFLLDLARALGQAGTTVQVVAPHAAGLPDRHVVGGIEVVRVRYAADARETLAYTGTMAEQATGSVGGALALLALLGAMGRAVRAQLRTDLIDLVHAHWWFPAALAVGRTVAGARLPFVVTAHGSDVRLARGGLARRLARHALAPAHGVTTVSRWLGDALQPLAPVPVSITPMPADALAFAPDPTVPRDPHRVLFVGRLNAQKNPGVLIEALAHLPPTTTLELVADGADRDRLAARASALGLGERVVFAGALPRHAIPDRMRRAALVAVPSRGEGFGLVAAEALLCGTPVVAADDGGLRDIVRHDETGLAVTGDDPHAWAAAIGALLADRPRADALARAGQSAMTATVAPAAVAARMQAVYADAIARSRRHA
jgi:glycosyltransferase involved in cell wall biosynthesis